MEKVIINVGRQVGCGGREIAQLLAKEFGARLLDKELLDLAAQESGFSAKLFKQHDEHRGFLNHLFHFRGTVTSGPFYEARTSSRQKHCSSSRVMPSGGWQVRAHVSS